MNKKKSLLALLLAFSFLGGTAMTASPDAFPAGIQLFVALDGSDMAEGSLAHPFQTLQRAQIEVRALKASSDQPITVNIREGEYFFSSSLSFGAEDSGAEAAPITWQAYDDERVLLSGGIRLPVDKIQPVTDEAILSRLPDDAARAHLRRIDLSGYLGEWPGPVAPDSTWEAANSGPEIYINGTPLTLSRWPNDVGNRAYLYADSAEALSGEQFAPARLTSRTLAARAARWSPGAWEGMYLYSFIAYDYTEGIFDLASFDPDTGEMVTTGGHWGTPGEHPRFYVFNLLEEIDLPGESYIDYENKVIYFYPPEDLEDAEIYLSLLTDPLVYLYAAEYLTFRGLDLCYTRGNPFLAYWADTVTVEDCTLAHSSQPALVLDGATGCTVRNCHIYDTSDGGIYLWDGGGRREFLVSSGNVIENNHIHHTSRLKKTYQVPIMCISPGVVIRNNEIHDTNHIAIDISSSNDAVIEYNEIYNVCQETSDSGAIYYGRDPSIMGITIRYNYFHDIGNAYGGVGQQAIFCDDGASMPHIYGNLFVNTSDPDSDSGSAVKANGSQFGVVEHNIFVDVPHAALFGTWSCNYDRRPIKEDWWLMNMYGVGDPPEESIWKKITGDIDFFSVRWREHYRGTQWEPAWEALSPGGHDTLWQLIEKSAAEDPLDYGSNPALYEWAYENAPALTNLLRGNVCVNLGSEELSHGGNGREENNYIAGTDIFRDYEKGDFRLTGEGLAGIRQAIPGFEEIPLDSIGMH